MKDIHIDKNTHGPCSDSTADNVGMCLCPISDCWLTFYGLKDRNRGQLFVSGKVPQVGHLVPPSCQQPVALGREAQGGDRAVVVLRSKLVTS